MPGQFTERPGEQEQNTLDLLCVIKLGRDNFFNATMENNSTSLCSLHASRLTRAGWAGVLIDL